MTDQIHPKYMRPPTTSPRTPRKTIGEMSLWELWCSLWQEPAREQAPRELTHCVDYSGSGRSDDIASTAQQSDNDDDGDSG